MSLGNKETMARNIKKYLAVRKKDQAEVCKDLNFPETTFSGWVNAKNYPRIDKIEMMANYFGIEKSDLIEDETNTIKASSILIPVLGRVQAGLPIEAVENIIDYEEIPGEMASQGEYFGLQIKGESMEPKFSEGDVVIVKKQPDIESGQVGIIIVNGTDATIKRVVKHGEGGISLIALNPAYSPKFYTNHEIANMPVNIIGRVVELRAKF